MFHQLGMLFTPIQKQYRPVFDADLRYIYHCSPTKLSYDPQPSYTSLLTLYWGTVCSQTQMWNCEISLSLLFETSRGQGLVFLPVSSYYMHEHNIVHCEHGEGENVI